MNEPIDNNVLFYRGNEHHGHMLTGHYLNNDGVYITYFWLFRYWRDKEKKIQYFKAFLGDNYYGEVDNLDEFKEEIQRTFKIDVLLNSRK